MAETVSCVLILPAALRDAGNALGEAQGWGPGSYAVPLSSDGGATVTHYGCRPDVSADFLARLENPPPEAVPIIAALIVDIAEHGEWGADHFDAVIAQHGLVRTN